MVRAIVGGCWGDEGKGKMTDLLGENSDIVVRFQGGANAGHTIINQYGKFALHLLPSGIFHQNIVNVIAQGVAFNIEQFFHELDDVTSKGVPMPNIVVSDRAQVVMPYHVLFDALEEQRLGGKGFGSTKSGIAPFYSDKYLKIGVQVCELYDDERLMAKLRSVCEQKNATLTALYHYDELLDPQKLFDRLTSLRERLRPFVGDAAVLLNKAVREDKTILLEGQLGSLKDPDNGIYPFTTSSSPLAGFASVGAAIPPWAIRQIIVVVKSYSSAVGAGAFVSEIFGDEAQELRDRGGDGGEYGATTGRPRRMGWLDTVAVKYGCMLQGCTDVCLSLIDVLGYLDTIPVCTAYEIDGAVTEDFPVTPLLDRAKPVYEYVDGWKCDIKGCRRYEDLPENARRYVEFIEKKIGYPITIISTGPKRDDIIYR